MEALAEGGMVDGSGPNTKTASSSNSTPKSPSKPFGSTPNVGKFIKAGKSSSAAKTTSSPTNQENKHAQEPAVKQKSAAQRVLKNNKVEGAQGGGEGEEHPWILPPENARADQAT